MLSALMGLLIVAQPAPDATPQSAGLSALRVVVAAPVYQPDGAVSIETAALSTATPGVVHLYGRRSLCDTATSGAAEPSDAGFGWRLTLSTVRAEAAAMVVSVDWQRVWDRGQRLTNGPSGTVQLTLHPGDRIPLDHIPNATASDTCRAVGMSLEVTVARTAASQPVNSALIPLGSVEGGAGGGAMLAADLWLVHRLPTGVEQAHHQKVQLPANGAPFSFAAVTLDTPRGEVAVEVSGSFKRYRAPTGAEFLYVAMVRSITGGALPSGGVRGGTTTVIPQPSPAEVLSLEMPGPGAGDGSGGMLRGGGGGGGPRGGGPRGGGAARPGIGPVPPSGSPRSGGPALGAGGGGGTGGQVGPLPGAKLAGLAQALGVLDGHMFSVRVRLTPVPGM